MSEGGSDGVRSNWRDLERIGRQRQLLKNNTVADPSVL